MAKTFGIFIILVLINIGVSNSEVISFRLWPFDFDIVMNSGLCFVVLFLLAFLAGGLFLWMNAFSETRIFQKNTKKQIQNLKKQLKETEKRTEV